MQDDKIKSYFGVLIYGLKLYIKKKESGEYVNPDFAICDYYSAINYAEFFGYSDDETFNGVLKNFRGAFEDEMEDWV